MGEKLAKTLWFLSALLIFILVVYFSTDIFTKSEIENLLGQKLENRVKCQTTK